MDAIVIFATAVLGILGIWAFFKLKTVSMILKLFSVIIIIPVCVCQDAITEDPPLYAVEPPPELIAPAGDGPLIFPEPMQQATQALANAVSNGWDEEQAVQATHRAFLGNDSLNLSNASLFYA